MKKAFEIIRHKKAKSILFHIAQADRHKAYHRDKTRYNTKEYKQPMNALRIKDGKFWLVPDVPIQNEYISKGEEVKQVAIINK